MVNGQGRRHAVRLFGQAAASRRLQSRFDQRRNGQERNAAGDEFGHGNLVGGNTINAIYDAESKLRTINRAYLLSGPGDKIFCNGFDDGTNNCTNPPGGGTTTWTYGTDGERSTEQSNQSQGLRYFGPDGYELIAATGTSKHELGPVLVTRTGGASSQSQAASVTCIATSVPTLA